MYKITVTTANNQTLVFKSDFKCVSARIKALPYTFVQSNIINENEWQKSNVLITDRFNLKICSLKIDGRLKENQDLKYFSWNILKTFEC